MKKLLGCFLLIGLLFSVSLKSYSVSDSPAYKNYYQNISKAESIEQKQKLALNFLKSSNNEIEKSKAFYAYRVSLYDRLYKLNGDLGGTVFTGSSEEPPKLTPTYLKLGLKYTYVGEGLYMLVENHKVTYSRFAPYLGQNWKDFLSLCIKEKNTYHRDAYLSVEINDLVRRIVTWEDFINKYPSFPENNEIKAKLDSYVSAWERSKGHFIYSENPADEGKYKPEIINSYSSFLANNTDSKYYPQMKAWLEALSRNNYRYSEDMGFVCPPNPYPVKSYNEKMWQMWSP